MVPSLRLLVLRSEALAPAPADAFALEVTGGQNVVQLPLHVEFLPVSFTHKYTVRPDASVRCPFVTLIVTALDAGGAELPPPAAFVPPPLLLHAAANKPGAIRAATRRLLLVFTFMPDTTQWRRGKFNDVRKVSDARVGHAEPVRESRPSPCGSSGSRSPQRLPDRPTA